ncbi:MAG: OpgC domain-containing protein [Alphaproteobacteria bacterium]|nr:OpgC domain-containing protein [Alphaproteobacteria bacterium]
MPNISHIPPHSEAIAPLKNKSPRDMRLDFFRGVAFVIIFIAHSNGNILWDYIPARFGLSDATELFIFISGYAAALAFGGAFVKIGFKAGLARIFLRISQLYLAHIMTVFGVIALTAQATLLTGIDYVVRLQIAPFLSEPATTSAHIFVLRYVPPYLDILPVYMAILAAVPLVMVLAKIWVKLPIWLSFLLYCGNLLHPLNFSSDPNSDKVWLMNPLAWQFLFFLGFGFSRKWLALPRQFLFRQCVTILSLIFVALGLLLRLSEQHHLNFIAENLTALSHRLEIYPSKPNLDPFRLLHFLATAWLAFLILAEPRQAILQKWGGRVFVHLGRQGLVVFLVGIFLSHLSGIAFDWFGRAATLQIAVNLVAIFIMYGAASLSAWIKSRPWQVSPTALKVP